MRKDIYILTFVILALSGFTLTFIEIMNTVLDKPKQSLRLQLKPIQEPKKEPWYVDNWEDGELVIVDNDAWYTLACCEDTLAAFVEENGTENVDYVNHGSWIERTGSCWMDEKDWLKKYAEANIRYWTELPE